MIENNNDMITRYKDDRILPSVNMKGGKPQPVASSARCLVGVLICGVLILLILSSAGVVLRHEGRLPRDLGASTVSSDVQTLLERISGFEVIHWTGSKHTAQEALERIVPQVASFFVVSAGPAAPVRRAPDQPFLTCADSIALPCSSFNAAAQSLETALGPDSTGNPRRLFPLNIDIADFSSHWGLMAGVVRPYVVWEVGSGTVLVDSSFAARVWGTIPEEPHSASSEPTSPEAVRHMAQLMADGLFKHLATAVPHVAAAIAQQSSMQRAMSILGPALSVAIAGAFAAAPPLWFCIVCPAVLGLMAPLAINLALNQVAGYVCTHFSLPDDQCFDLLLGALGLGFVLSLASAIPIFYVCKLMECSHRNQPPEEQMAGPRAAPRGVVAHVLRVLGLERPMHSSASARRRLLW